MEKDPDNVEARLALVDSLLKMGELDAAQQHLEQAQARAQGVLSSLQQMAARMNANASQK